MKKSEDKQLLYEAYTEIIWMAMRYANGRHTYAPSMVRSSIRRFQEVFPDWKPKFDEVILSDARRMIEFEDGLYGQGISLRSDYLDDLMEGEEKYG